MISLKNMTSWLLVINNDPICYLILQTYYLLRLFGQVKCGKEMLKPVLEGRYNWKEIVINIMQTGRCVTAVCLQTNFLHPCLS